MSDQLQKAFQKLPTSSDALLQSGIRRMYAESTVTGKPNYICYLPEFAVLMDSTESYQKAEELCFKYLSSRLTKLKNVPDLAQWRVAFPTLNAELSVTGNVILVLDEVMIEHLTGKFQLNFEQRVKAYEFS